MIKITSKREGEIKLKKNKGRTFIEKQQSRASFLGKERTIQKEKKTRGALPYYKRKNKTEKRPEAWKDGPKFRQGNALTSSLTTHGAFADTKKKEKEGGKKEKR